MAYTRIMLTALTGFLALTAIAGGIALLGGNIAPDEDLLDGSPFDSFVIPALALLGVGIASLLAMILVLYGRAIGFPLSVLVAVAILIYELVEVWVVGFHFLQVVYAVIGLLMFWLAARQWNESGRRLSLM